MALAAEGADEVQDLRGVGDNDDAVAERPQLLQHARQHCHLPRQRMPPCKPTPSFSPATLVVTCMLARIPALLRK